MAGGRAIGRAVPPGSLRGGRSMGAVPSAGFVTGRSVGAVPSAGSVTGRSVGRSSAFRRVRYGAARRWRPDLSEASRRFTAPSGDRRE